MTDPEPEYSCIMEPMKFISMRSQYWALDVESGEMVVADHPGMPCLYGKDAIISFPDDAAFASANHEKWKFWLMANPK